MEKGGMYEVYSPGCVYAIWVVSDDGADWDERLAGGKHADFKLDHSRWF
jgi:hypothetical protein